MVLRNWNYFSPIEERGDMKGRKPKDGAMRLPSGNAGRRAIKESSGSDLFMREPVVKPGGLNELESQEWDRLTSTPAPIFQCLSWSFTGGRAGLQPDDGG